MKGDNTFLSDFDLKSTIFEAYLKRVTPGGRHVILLFYVISKYLELKKLVKDTGKKITPENFPHLVPRVIFMGGMSRPGDKLIL